MFVNCHQCSNQYETYQSRIGKTRYCSRRCLALSKTDQLFGKGNTVNIGRELSKHTKDLISKAHRGKRSTAKSLSKSGEKNPNWRGGTSPENKRLRRSADFFAWRKAVFERDNYTCQGCKKRGGLLHPDHIKQFAYYPELRFDINNGRTLCVDCHRKTSTWGFKKHKLPTKQT